MKAGVESLISYALYFAKGHIFQFYDQANVSHRSHLIMQFNAATPGSYETSREGPCISAWVFQNMDLAALNAHHLALEVTLKSLTFCP